MMFILLAAKDRVVAREEKYLRISHCIFIDEALRRYYIKYLNILFILTSQKSTFTLGTTKFI